MARDTTDAMDALRADAPGTRAYLAETAALPLSDERVATEAACTFAESIVGAIAGSNAEWRCRRRARATGLALQSNATWRLMRT